MKTILRSTFAAIFLVILGIWSPWLSWNVDFLGLLGIARTNPTSTLQVVSLAGTLDIQVNGKSDTATQDLPSLILNIEPGEHLVTIEKKSDVTGAYYSFSQLIYFENNAEVVLAINLGPEKEFSEWHLITPVLKPNREVAGTNLRISVDQPDAIVRVGNLPLEATFQSEYQTTTDLTSQKTIYIQKRGFEAQTFTIFPETQEERDLLSDFDFEVSTVLMYQPVDVI